MVKRAVLEKVGLLDATFFAYFEEIDWCARAARAGFEIWYEPTAKVCHKGHGSGTGRLREYLLHRNQLLFMRKNARWPACAFFWLYYLLFKFPKVLLQDLFRGDWSRAGVLLQAVGWNFGLFQENNPLAQIAK
jgi:GT2 family glycosyltransferase